ncbi:lysozyme inhibitor LprI family protein [Xanthomonas cannabis]|uniref:lysozyme inhibitor LprI family protein n=1 Tax=Xanthomonas cannabis TaxID=1885674 RepID=UPI0006902927|nr:lysozyme inhibitor LprI family protein [Xanthomonas cannabis]
MIIDQATNQVHMTMRSGWIFLVLLFSAPSHATERCHDLETTTDSNKCWSAEVSRSQQRLAAYLAAARTRAVVTLGVSGEAFDNAQAAWTSYKTLHCSNIRQRWTAATVGTAKAARCAVDLNDQRAHDLWQSYLTYEDRTPPLLPEPE